MLWRTGLVVLVLGLGQVKADEVKPTFIEDALEAGWSSGQSRIVSGWEAYPGQHPHQVNLRMVNAIGSVNGCGGSLVSRQWVITAAHCTATRVTIVIRLGVTNMTTPQHLMESNEWYNHPSFNELTPNVVQPNEVAMLKLPRPAVYTRLVQPIRIQSSEDAYRDYNNEILHASGHGHIWTGGPAPEVLNWVYLRGVAHATCQGTFPTVVNENTICARWFNVTSQSTCQGDSGGPLVHVGSDGVPILVGVTSFVAGGDFGCHSGIPAGFIRPGPFHSWYRRVTGIDFENLNEEDDEVTTPQPEDPTTIQPEDPTTQEPDDSTTTRPDRPTTQEPDDSTTPRPDRPTTQGPDDSTTPRPEDPSTEQPEDPTTLQPEDPTTQVPEDPTTQEPEDDSTTKPPPTTPEESEEEPSDESDDSSDSESDEDPSIGGSKKKRVEVKVKVKVRVNKELKVKKKVHVRRKHPAQARFFSPLS